MTILHFPETQAHVALLKEKLKEAETREAELRRFLERIQSSQVDLHLRYDRLEATLNSFLRQMKKGRRRRDEE